MSIPKCMSIRNVCPFEMYVHSSNAVVFRIAGCAPRYLKILNVLLKIYEYKNGMPSMSICVGSSSVLQSIDVSIHVDTWVDDVRLDIRVQQRDTMYVYL